MPRKRSSSRNLLLQKDANNQLISGIGPGVGLEFIQKFFPQINHTLRIASAYFSLKGYRIGRPYLSSDIVVRMLIGKGDSVDAQEAILDEVLNELKQIDGDLWQTINEIVYRMNENQFFIREARSISHPFHCKYYVGDDTFAWHGSTNYSENGLSGKSGSNAEQASLLTFPEQISDFTDWFDTVAQEANDVLEPIKKLLEEWLRLAEPFDVYLKTLSLLLGVIENEDRPFSPVFFQQYVIQYALSQAEQYGGSLIVAATGLGKTIIGSEIARWLQLNDVCKRTIIIAPAIIRDKWVEQMRIKDVNHTIFGSTIPFKVSSRNSKHEIFALERELARADGETVILIDEAHIYRNQLAKERLHNVSSRVFELFVPAVKRGAKIFLLTATAFGTGIHNLNGLLYLLPHKAESPRLFEDDSPWQVNSTEEFIDLPVVTVLGLPHVLSLARLLGHIDENDRTFITFGKTKKYLPKVMQLRPVFYELFLQESILSAFDRGYFAQDGGFVHKYLDEDTSEPITGTVDVLQKSALTAWLSSPEALLESIKYNLNTADNQIPDGQMKIFPDQQNDENYTEDSIRDENDKKYKAPFRIPINRLVVLEIFTYIDRI